MRYMLLVLILLVAGCASQQAPGGAEMANPASVHCEEQGGELEMVDTPNGTIGMCHLPDGTVCEEWAYYNGECPADVSNFTECVQAGNPVMESYPRQCRADGEVFIEQIPQRDLCEDRHGGRWLKNFEECEGVTQNACEQMGGTFDGCASACRHDPAADMCTAQCVPVCRMNG